MQPWQTWKEVKDSIINSNSLNWFDENEHFLYSEQIQEL